MVWRAADATTTTATIDHDGTIIESHKRDAQVAYEGTRGYQPLVALGRRSSWSWPTSFATVTSRAARTAKPARRAFDTLPPTMTTRYFRGTPPTNYDPPQVLGERADRLRHQRRHEPELRKVCAGQPEGAWQELEQRERERVELAEVEFTPGVWPKAAEPLRYIALRFTPLQAELFGQLAPVPRGGEQSPRAHGRRGDCVASGKAGTIEQVHRVLKDELGAGVMPCQLFGANAAWFRINVLTFNLLTALKRRALPERYRLARPKRLRFEVFTLPGKLAIHESQLSVQVSAADTRLQEMVAARQRLLTMRESTSA